MSKNQPSDIDLVTSTEHSMAMASTLSIKMISEPFPEYFCSDSERVELRTRFADELTQKLALDIPGDNKVVVVHGGGAEREGVMSRQMKIGSDPKADAETTLKVAIEQTTEEAERSFLTHLLTTLDLASYADLQHCHLAMRSKPAKFLDLTAWMRHKFALAKNLGLDNAEPMRILDIGCGPSQFGVVGRYFGHEVEGLDIPGNALYGDLNDFFNLRRFVHAVRPMRPLARELGRYDFITALSANFYLRPDDTLFTIDEWRFFMENIVRDHLNPGGRIFFNLNPLADHEGLHFWDDEFAHMVEQKGGALDRKTGFVAFDNPKACAA